MLFDLEEELSFIEGVFNRPNGNNIEKLIEKYIDDWYYEGDFCYIHVHMYDYHRKYKFHTIAIFALLRERYEFSHIADSELTSTILERGSRRSLHGWDQPYFMSFPYRKPLYSLPDTAMSIAEKHGIKCTICKKVYILRYPDERSYHMAVLSRLVNPAFISGRDNWWNWNHEPIQYFHSLFCDNCAKTILTTIFINQKTLSYDLATERFNAFKAKELGNRILRQLRVLHTGKASKPRRSSTIDKFVSQYIFPDTPS